MRSRLGPEAWGISPGTGVLLVELQQVEGKMQRGRRINFRRCQTPPDCGKTYQNESLAPKNPYAKTRLFYA